MKFNLYAMSALFCMFSLKLYCQIPLGKDFNIGKQEIKMLMQKNGFHFLKESPTFNYNYSTGKHDIPSKDQLNLRYKEEISIILYKNEYDNLDFILIDPENKVNYDKILKTFGFSKWIFLYSKENGDNEYYQTNNGYAILIKGRQINFKREP